jgi:predicted peptidase
MIKHARLWLAIGLVVFLTPLFAKAADDQSGQQQAKVFEKQITVKLNYLLFLPEGYANDTDKKWPLMLFLHGAGERGSDVNKVKVHGPPKIVEQKKDFPFIVVSPQCPADSWWRPMELMSLLDEIQKDYRVDADRVYLTGLSMGGFGTWELATQAPQRFAAIAPICGGGNPALARRIKDLPIWVFHGAADRTVPVARSEEMVEALKKAGSDVKFTKYEGVDHDSWTRTYANEELYQWMLSHKRGEKRTAAAPAAPATATPAPAAGGK